MRVTSYWVIAAACGLVACGGSSSSGAGGDAGAGDGGPGNEAGSDVTVPRDGDGTDVVNHPDSPVGQDGGPGPDGASDGSVADVQIPDGGGITCQPAPCPVGSEICCYDRNGGTLSCTSPVSCNTANDVRIPCSSAADCAAIGNPGDVCCATLGSGVGLASVTCGPPSICAPGGLQRAELCDPTLAMPCPRGGTCQSGAGLPPGYYGCL